MPVKADFPSSSALSATTLALVAIGYVLAAAAPHLRAMRNAQAAFNEAKAATLDSLKKCQRVQESMIAAQAAIGELDNLGPNTAVLELRRTKHAVVRFLDDLDLGILAVERSRAKMKALRRFKMLTQAFPDLENAIDKFLAATEEVVAFKISAEALRDQDFPAQCDEAIRVAVEQATDYAMVKSLELANTRSRPNAAQALASLKKIHDTAQAHGFKLGA